MIAIIDCGAGNVGSVIRAVEYLGSTARLAGEPRQLSGAEKIILPGQGQFGALMRTLSERRLLDPLREALQAGTPYLGICLGLQALYETSDEAPGVRGLGILPGRVKRLTGISKVPHVGWSTLEITRQTAVGQGIATGSFVYYCHSYYCPADGQSFAVSEYGQQFSAGIEMGNICAVQFHPEKSGKVGLRILKNFLGPSS
jgi:imidazole glycerol phosphate synthase glutamine amidotransferase subunit